MKKLLFSVVVMLVVCSSATAQQRAQYSQYVFNNFLLNPALTGIEDYTDAKIGYRRQWVGMEGAPTSFYASIHTSIGKSDNTKKQKQFQRRTATPKALPAAGAKKKNYRIYRTRPHHGLGAIMQSERSGPLTRTGFQASYAFHLPISKQFKLAMGAATGV
ncbi:MAG: type IX secretion system membrane protein PorP/SprF, partial [Sphingobacteriales bacterium]